MRAVVPDALAHWAFDSGTSADLATTDSTASGGFTLASDGGAAGTAVVTFNSGYVSLNTSAELLATGINSTAYSGLTSAVTILVTMRYDGVALGTPTYTAGLLTQSGATTNTFAGMAFVHKGNPTAQTEGTYVNNPAGSVDQNFNATGSTKEAQGTWFTVAMVFNSGTVTGYLDGVQYWSGSLANSTTSLEAFNSFGIGRVFNGATSIAASYADIQVYDVALSSTDVGTLSAAALATTAIPEPGTWAVGAGLVSLAAAFFFRRRSRSVV